ncbi:hypothetical protein ACHQM5_009890 [Ranunculus cassubicifolius]
MGEPALGHQMVCLECRFNVVLVYANRDSHQHVLWSFNNFALHFQEIRSLKRFETKIIIVKICHR